MAQWGGTAMFSKKVWVSVVWAAFRERNFEVGEPFLRARSVPSKYCFFRTYASARRIFLIKSHISPLFSSPYPFSSPFVCHLLATYLHRNLIGISSEPHRNLTEWWACHQAAISEVPSLSSPMFIIPNVIRVFSPPATCLVFASGLANILASNLLTVACHASVL